MPQRNSFLSFVLPLLAAMPIATLAATASAADEACAVPSKMLTYFEADTLPAKPTTRCDIVDGKCKKLALRGRLYEPQKAGKTPIIVYNHGSGENVGETCELATFFTKRGYAVFVPHRRGHGESSGVYLPGYVSNFCSKPGDASFCKMEYLHEQVDDIKAAIAFVKKRPGIDGSKLAIMGHSYGGIVTMFANTKQLGQRAVLDFAGASQSWEGNDAAREEMKKAVEKAVAPMFFFEPLNDKSIEPTIELARIAGRNCKQYQSTMYPAVDVDGDKQITPADYSSKENADGDTNRDKAHGKSTRMVDVWGPAAHEFMQRYFEHPAKPFDKLCDGTSLITK